MVIFPFFVLCGFGSCFTSFPSLCCVVLEVVSLGSNQGKAGIWTQKTSATQAFNQVLSEFMNRQGQGRKTPVLVLSELTFWSGWRTWPTVSLPQVQGWWVPHLFPMSPSLLARFHSRVLEAHLTVVSCAVPTPHALSEPQSPLGHHTAGRLPSWMSCTQSYLCCQEPKGRFG